MKLPLTGLRTARSAALAWALALGCEARPEIEILEGEVTVHPEHCHWQPIDASRPTVFDASASLEVREAVGVDVDFTGFYLDNGTPSPTVLQGPWTVVSDHPEIVEPISGPQNTIAILAHAPGSAVLTLTLIGSPGSFDVPVEVIAAEDFVVNVPSAGGAGGGGSGTGGGLTGGGGGAGGDGGAP